MLVVGLKLTHDGGAAAIRDGELLFSVEVEKLDNRLRYSALSTEKLILRVLGDHGISPAEVDALVIDGWDGDRESSALLDGQEVKLSGYAEAVAGEDLLDRATTGRVALAGREVTYTSYPHVTGHAYSALATSPASADEPTVILIWDGGLFPRLYLAEPGGRVRALGPVGYLIGHCYAMAAHHFGPYRRDQQSTQVDDLSVAGKLMAYIALGQRDETVYQDLTELTDQHFEGTGPQARTYRETIKGIGSTGEPSHKYFHAFFDELRDRVDRRGGIPDENVLATVHEFLEDYLAGRVTGALRSRLGPGPWPVSFAGGCALNIKWNTRLRAQPEIASLWVPPFPNDSGSALGNAAIAAFRDGGMRRIRWDVRGGPELVPLTPGQQADYTAQGWTSRPCGVSDLAAVLHETGEPVVLLHGRAELGPRALGGRSIIAPATDPAMKQRLNDIKKREHYRPVAPICLAEHAPGIFSPGTPDPYMLFDHEVRPDWRDRIPAVIHLDGTARLQTVGPSDDPALRELLTVYHDLSGIPVLCNTSANLHGSGFFPDVASALSWGKVRYVWTGGILHEKDPDFG